jgi:hypothetical protein
VKLEKKEVSSIEKPQENQANANAAGSKPRQNNLETRRDRCEGVGN